MKRAALFDMDRTLVRRETASLYVRHQRDVGEATLWDAVKVLFWVTQYTFGIVDAPAIARRVIASLRGMPERVMAARCEDLFAAYVIPHVAEEGRRAVERARARGEITAIVTGASVYSARPLARLLGIDHVIGSEFEVDARGLFTGRAIEPLCYGAGKIAKTAALGEALGFRVEESVFYSDSFTDVPLLAAVREPVVVNPDPRLRRLARAKKWPIETW